MSTEERLHRLETVFASLVADVSEIKGELRWMRYIMLAILGILLKDTFWPG